MRELPELFANNREWAAKMTRHDPDFFRRLSLQQSPEYLWIGCSDSRVPANEIVGLAPGEMFVHRNIANIVSHADLNCLSVLQFAIDVLHVRHVIVTGHYNCGGVRASLDDKRHGLVDNWLRHLHDVQLRYHDELAAVTGFDERVDRLCELNVREQVANLAATTIVQDAWTRGQPLTLHGWIYDLKDGLLRDLDCTLNADDAVNLGALRVHGV